MFAAVGNHVETLHRSRIGSLALSGFAPGAWRALDSVDIAMLLAKHGVK